MHTLLSYDVNVDQTRIKKELTEIGYKESYILGTTVYLLPNTTMYSPNKTPQQAINELTSICGKLGVRLLKAVAVDGSSWAGIPGQ